MEVYRNMAESKKYNLKEELVEADKTLTGSPEILGKAMLTIPQYVNSMRTNMFTSHLNQYKVQENTEFPLWFTNNENLVGEYSDGYFKTDDELKIVAKVVKYESIVKNPTHYVLFVYNKGKHRYEIIKREDVKNLTEVFAYRLKNEVIDSYEVGDTVPAGTILYRSTSYDDYMNYGFGINVPIMFSTDPDTSEDATKISKTLANKMLATETDLFTISLNDNDFPLNLYGDEFEYKSFPNIGEKIDTDIFMATRRQYNDQLLNDFRTDALQQYRDGDVCYYSIGEVSDIIVYCNKDELEENSFNRQVLEYYYAQNDYYEEIVKICEEIRRSGEKYSSDLDYLYKRSVEFLDKTKKWKNNDNTFSNFELEVSIKRKVGLSKGSKVTGRFGNKSVVAVVEDDENMPYTEDGVRIEMVSSLLAFVNRTIAAPLFEVSTSFITGEAIRKMKILPTQKEKEILFFDILESFNKKQAKKTRKIYGKLSAKEKRAYLEEVMNGHFHIHQPSTGEDYPFFYKLLEIYEKYDWLKPKQLYIKKWGRTIPILRKQYIGQMYVMMLKQTSLKGFSARGMGAINSKGLPERSYKSKAHTDLYSTSNIRFGEFESLNFLIGMSPEELSLLHACYRTSEEARSDLGKHILKPDSDYFKIDKSYTSRVAEIMNVLMKSLGYEIDIIDERNEIVEMDDNQLMDFTLNGMTYLCTGYQKFLYERLEEFREEIRKENPVMDMDEFAKKLDEKMLNSGFVMGMSHYKDRINIFQETDEMLSRLKSLNETKPKETEQPVSAEPSVTTEQKGKKQNDPGE